MELHYGITMDPIMMSYVIMMSHRLYYGVALMTLVLQLDVFLHYGFKK